MNLDKIKLNEIYLNLDLLIAQSVEHKDKLRLKIIKHWFQTLEQFPQCESLFYLWNDKMNQTLKQAWFDFPKIMGTNVDSNKKEKISDVLLTHCDFQLLVSDIEINKINEVKLISQNKNEYIYLINTDELFITVNSNIFIQTKNEVLLIKDGQQNNYLVHINDLFLEGKIAC